MIKAKARQVFLNRFTAHPEMIALFSDSTQRAQVAADVFAERWQEAQVTVTRLDGIQFFID